MLRAILIAFFRLNLAVAEDSLLNQEDQNRLVFFMARHQDIVKNNKRNFNIINKIVDTK